MTLLVKPDFTWFASVLAGLFAILLTVIGACFLI